MKVTFIPADERQPIKVEYRAKLPPYRQMETFLEGPLERFELKVKDQREQVVRAMMYVNENGQIEDKPVNKRATWIAHHGAILMNTRLVQVLYGNAILQQPDDRVKKKRTNASYEMKTLYRRFKELCDNRDYIVVPGELSDFFVLREGIPHLRRPLRELEEHLKTNNWIRTHEPEENNRDIFVWRKGVIPVKVLVNLRNRSNPTAWLKKRKGIGVVSIV